jgi:hypothetical protein
MAERKWRKSLSCSNLSGDLCRFIDGHSTVPYFMAVAYAVG